MSAQRIQRQRTKGWRMPEGAVYVGRPTSWGNPFPVDGGWITWAAVAIGHRGDAPGRRSAAVALYRAWITGKPIEIDLSAVTGFAFTAARLVGTRPDLPARPDLAPLAGRDIACWCPLDQPCHADVLLELANGGCS